MTSVTMSLVFSIFMMVDLQVVSTISIDIHKQVGVTGQGQERQSTGESSSRTRKISVLIILDGTASCRKRSLRCVL